MDKAALVEWLAQTKFHPPRLREDMIPRTRLLGLLRDAVTSRPLTLLSAPAGYGKTTLLAALIADFGFRNAEPPDPQSAIRNLQSCWLSLDDADNDPVRFFAAVVAALQSLQPACGAEALTLLNANPGADLLRVVTLLINDLTTANRQSPIALVLDDLHLITEPAIYAALDYLIERLPPSLRLVIATRHDPPLSLARLRARGELAEFRLAELRFTHDEAAEFLNDRLRLGLAPGDLLALEARTEGWAAGLRLTAGSLDGLPTASDRAAFIARLVQTERHAFDFLAGEVLDRQPPDARAFLLQTSILAELTPAVCRAVTGRGGAAALLEDLYRRNLFLTAIETEPQSTSASSPLQGAPAKLNLQPEGAICNPTATTPSSPRFCASGWIERCRAMPPNCTAAPRKRRASRAGPSAITWRRRCGKKPLRLLSGCPESSSCWV